MHPRYPARYPRATKSEEEFGDQPDQLNLVIQVFNVAGNTIHRTTRCQTNRVTALGIRLRGLEPCLTAGLLPFAGVRYIL